MSATSGDRRSALSAQAARHREERRQVITQHPQVQQLAGPFPYSAFGAAIVLAVHLSVMSWVAQQHWVVVFLTAFFVGQVCLHSAGSLVHETAHRLVFSKAGPKLLFDLTLEVILTSFSRQLTYQHEHLSSHHPYLGDYERDYEHEDICRFAARRSLRAKHPRTQRLLTAAELTLHLLPLGFLFADKLLLPFYEKRMGVAVRDRARRIGATEPSRAHRQLFVVVSGLSLAAVTWWFGPYALLYQVWSLSLFLGKAGVTNLGQSLAEHPGNDEQNPTRSTYGWANAVFFNTGYHHEHHTFPNVAWNRLPLLKAMAPEVFCQANSRSYLRCWWDHLREDFGPSRVNAWQAQPQDARCARGNAANAAP